MPRLVPAANENLPARGTTHAVSLPLTLAIGFTGHRKLPDEEKARAAILEFLQGWKTRTSAIVYGVSSVAAGGDLLFAECCNQLDLPIRVFLPMPKELFRNDFDEATWKRAECVLGRALSVETTGGDGPREELYYECGIETVLQSQVLLALWNGQPSEGLGGTADIVSFAKDQGRPVVWINSDTREIRHFNEEKELQVDPEMEFLNGLPDSGVQTDITTPGDLARAWFLKIDESASHAAPHVRRLAAIPILCAATAAILSGIGSFGSGNETWLGIGTGLGIMAGALPIVMKLHARQVVWARIRTAAEICRSMLAFWPTPAPYHVIGPETVPELSGLLMSLNYLKMSDQSRRQTTLEEFRLEYRKERVQHQIDYFSRHARQSAREVRRYIVAIWISISIAMSANMWLLVNSHWLKSSSAVSSGLVPRLSGTVFFQLALIASALMVVNDSQRRRQRYGELHHLLMRWDSQLASSLTWSSLIRVATAVEKALLTEVIEWRSLIRHRKLSER